MANEYSPQEIQEILSAYAKAQSSGEAVSKDLSDAMSNATEATKQYNYSLKSGKDQLKDTNIVNECDPYKGKTNPDDFKIIGIGGVLNVNDLEGTNSTLRIVIFPYRHSRLS